MLSEHEQTSLAYHEADNDTFLQIPIHLVSQRDKYKNEFENARDFFVASLIHKRATLVFHLFRKPIVPPVPRIFVHL